ncbi:ATP synthase F1, gamma chain [Corynebacterium glutamicum MB001]|uniref:ATP synthase gamma chain n=1 Tax=Corynebacterium glutamicum (strain ATCC 13032 / DSM 20300 / JCM 1318 / BCRC 11384 / CCUG 27702 / LMG 3730 / NBRC 12168 / NCIMB 10025 / NRRL B-2784 / 534) TaxID=196627 RepID=ATPG_CORGL|nr:F0F1 ATP synthase subunit gamma [Corynebacterium glutamicum]Q79VG6.1 RecName: Full=ATP synthase gamma chain; AltName: Full=ATP synthase F1 sector gamma subunit; AltName: Full=F-ATPase gamma subunit [Corynebacterium glutamicum ATCC 13032]AGT05201.1 ATP synthase F1, gamma chain [Corynebacterium glutamicum MB001]AIK84898.1 ATP synthase F0F1 subunit gamma [Corynebacterium glutamicum]AIK87682.1 ATP synthase F0F1 subunit gamma [Corynebacterium glutamicum]ARV64631.1 ATP synthase subunit gamma [Cor
MATIRELRDRIRSVNSTKKITKAQELIATSRITKAQGRVAAAAPYAEEIQRVLERLASASSLDHPMLREREGGKRAAVLVVTSDRGMAGGYNHNVLKKAAELEKLLAESGYEVVRYVTGKKGVDYYKFRAEDVAGTWTGFSQDPDWAATHNVRRHLIDGFTASSEGEAAWREGLNLPEGQDIQGFDQVHVVYTEFISMLTQNPVVHQLLPVEPVIEDEIFEKGEDLLSSSGEVEPDYEFEPDADTLLEALLPQYVSRRLFSIFLEAAAAESASRRNAMKSATDNATELVKDLSRVANQARQAQITQEITEIVGGAGALADSGESD